ncbi:MAG TPA: zf-HC2 domain-containing protein, partial [Acidimicrobiales bacterium]|nr:zf-HC2 domain-containing protein [Acidimicrobiales bacterium]
MNQPIELSCGEVRNAVPEYALGLLPVDERAGVARHIMGCRECRLELEEMNALGDELIDLVPDAGPPAGFDRRVLAAIRQAGGSWDDRSRRAGRNKRFVIAGLAAAAAVALIVGLVVRGGNGKSHHEMTAALTA